MVDSMSDRYAERREGRVADQDEGGQGAEGDRGTERPARPAPQTDTAPPAQPEAQAGAAPEPAPKPRSIRRIVLMTAGAIAAAVAVWYGYNWWTTGRFMVSTDDAYVQADISTIAAKVSGYVTDVPIVENQQVKTGDVLAQIDDRDYRIAV
jgi:membrane fusion protein (multidrug efflux system)